MWGFIGMIGLLRRETCVFLVSLYRKIGGMVVFGVILSIDRFAYEDTYVHYSLFTSIFSLPKSVIGQQVTIVTIKSILSDRQ